MILGTKGAWDRGETYLEIRIVPAQPMCRDPKLTNECRKTLHEVGLERKVYESAAKKIAGIAAYGVMIGPSHSSEDKSSSNSNFLRWIHTGEGANAFMLSVTESPEKGAPVYHSISDWRYGHIADRILSTFKYVSVPQGAGTQKKAKQTK